MACPEGEDLCPTQRCECKPQSVIKSLFPEWATREDVAESFKRGQANANTDTATDGDFSSLDIDMDTIGGGSPDRDGSGRDRDGSSTDGLSKLLDMFVVDEDRAGVDKRINRLADAAIEVADSIESLERAWNMLFMQDSTTSVTIAAATIAFAALNF
mmetsp:Transcript_21598/g.26538  ORF Transcript_21598/g.26538 Transcript_21598/m.26538 type:complete len:157 (-) Transcript_21598:81-551(-)|eukprot:CAMPEP_0170469226 /NCGR_PEP_ID=MMETSP0123-20130129/12130_1 /TAXON_ID=182087 /ORGANISM="Favella ehrenbergii, Strain Fehren 1" /LENGTH=156 /DNA_ID=CAMNT_0010736031 /DNA_START=158 /DNA_END=628 /DNA_ORIENTATION=-